MKVIELLENSDLQKVVFVENGKTMELKTLNAHVVHPNIQFQKLNPLQTLFHLKYSDGSALVSTPTSSGKTLCAVDFINKHDGLKVYTVPTKALAHEIYKKLRQVFGDVDIRTGDVMEEFYELKSDLVVCTYESLLLSIRNGSWGSRAKALVIDEIHHVFTSRGSVIEEVVALLKDKIDILGLSATLPRFKDIAKWINAQLVIHSKWRPVPIVKNVHKFTADKDELPEELLEKLFEVSNDDENVILFVYKKSIGWDILKIVHEKGYTIANDTLPFDKGESDVSKFDFAYHNADIPVEEKNRIEELFRKGNIKFLIATQTLAYGVNLPADRVVILSTSYYDMERRKRIFLPSVVDMLQMEGRAGRFGIKNMGYVDIIMYKLTKESIDKETERVFLKGETEIMSDLKNIQSLFEDYLGPIARLSAFVLSAYYTSKGDVISFLKRTFSFRDFNDFKTLDILITFLKERGYIAVGSLTEKGMFSLLSGIPPTALEEFLKRLNLEGDIFVKVRPLIFTKRMKGAYDVFLDDGGFRRLFSHSHKLEPFGYPNDGSLELLFYIYGESFFLSNIHNPPSEMHLYTESIHLAKHLYALKEKGYMVADLMDILLIAHAVRYGLEMNYAVLGSIENLGHIRANALKIALRFMNLKFSFENKVSDILDSIDEKVLKDVLSLRYKNERILKREFNTIMNILRKQSENYLMDEGILRRLALIVFPKRRNEVIKADVLSLYQMLML